MKSNSKISLSLKDVYTYLLTHNRYGYTRRNHLEPSSAFDSCKELVPKMLKKDSSYSLYTVKQLCEECISDLQITYWWGIDDEYHNRVSYINFIEWCLSFLKENQTPTLRPIYNPATFQKEGEEEVYDIWPYNLDQYERNLKRDDEKRYIVYNNDNNEVLVDKDHALSFKEIIPYLCSQHGDSMIYNYQYKREDYDKNDPSFKFYRIPKVTHFYSIHPVPGTTKPVYNYRIERLIFPED